MNNDCLQFFGLEVKNLNEQSLIEIVDNLISLNKPGTICYVNANSLNMAYKDVKLKKFLSSFNILHPDGIGVFLASKFLYGKKGFTKRIAGSDFYVELIKHSLKNNWSFFFYGDKEETLNKISQTYPGLLIKGFCNGFKIKKNDLISNINNLNADILIVGLGSPKQEEWIVQNRQSVNSKVIIAVGDGIKVFARTKKRGPKLLRTLGLEWLVRLTFEPKRLWKRYIIGIPLFIFRVIKFKFSLK